MYFINKYNVRYIENDKLILVDRNPGVSFLLEHFFGFSMESAVIEYAVNPPKKFRWPYFR